MLKRLVFLALFFVAAIPAAQARIFTDAGGRSVTIPDKIGKVLPAGPPAAVLLYVLAPEKLAGWVKAPSEAEKEFLLPSTYDLPVYGRLTGKDATADIAAIKKAKPDLIIDVGTVSPAYIALADKIQKETGIPYILVDGSLEKTPTTLREVSRVLGVDDRGQELGAYADVKLKDLATALATIKAKDRPRVYYGRGPQGLQTGPIGSINLQILDTLGAVNVAGMAGKGGLTDVTLAEIQAWNPDVILAADAGFAASVKKDPAWAKIKAVKNGKVFKAPDLPFGWIDTPPAVNRLIGLAWLEATLYPGKVDVDVRAETRYFFNLFYQVDLTEEDFDTLFGGATDD